MKRKFLAALAAAALAAACAFGLSACERGSDGSDGKDGNDGLNGKDGVGIYSAELNTAGELVITLTDGTVINVGKVTGEGSFTESLLYREIKEDGEVTGYIVRGPGNVSALDIVIPATYNGKPVVRIDDGAFSDCDWITSVVIPDSVTEIGEKAFYNCNQLQDVYVGSGLTSSGSFAFGKCTSLENVYITDIAAWCNIKYDNLSATPMYFAENLYLNNQPVTEIEIDEGGVGDYAFYEYTGITSVTVNGSAGFIGASAFENCYNLESVVIGGDVASIGDSAFLGCTAIDTLVIGDKVEIIEDFAFSQCYSLTEVNIPSSVKEIGESAFTDCGNLETVTLNEGLEKIGICAFGGCYSLKSFIMPDTVTEIGMGILMFGSSVGFGDAIMSSGITELVMSENLTEITEFAFNGCAFSEIRIGSKVQTINYSAFFGCDRLQTIIMPKSVKKIVSYAFYRLASLESVFYEGTEEEWNLITIGKNGNEITEAEIYFYSETQPTEEGNYWHYVDGDVTKW